MQERESEQGKGQRRAGSGSTTHVERSSPLPPVPVRPLSAGARANYLREFMSRTHELAFCRSLLPPTCPIFFIVLPSGFRVRALAITPVGGIHPGAAVLSIAVSHHPRRGGSPHRELAQRERVHRPDRVHQVQDHQSWTQIGEIST